MKNEEIKDKAKSTNLEKYGKEYIFHTEDFRDKAKKSNISRYGVDHNMKNRYLALKVARSLNNCSILYHWKTNEEVVCVGSYERKVVEYFNKNKINFEWQPKTFETNILLPSGKLSSYTPDVFLSDLNLWVEIKGYMREDAKIKWDWFHANFPNSEIWNKEKLIQLNILNMS
jgi:hypothetical protein